MKCCVIAKTVNRARRHYDIMERIEVGRKKQKARLERLKCLDKESMVALLLELKLLYGFFYLPKKLIISFLQSAFFE